MRTIGIVTVGRSDYGYYLPVLRKIQAQSALKMRLIVSGMHLSPDFGLTVKEIEADGFEIAQHVEMLVAGDTPLSISKSIGLGVAGFSQAYADLQPDILLLLGDRFEMLAAGVAALPFAIPIAHIAGGELTEGLIDEAIRHSLTKMSHLHFVSTERYRERVIQMGEEPWRVVISGALSLDNLRRLKLLTLTELERDLDISLHPAPLLVTFHPVTLEYIDTKKHIGELISALETTDMPVIFTLPNSDTQNKLIVEAINIYTQKHHNSHLVVNLGTHRYFSLMKYAAAMVGNSSSGIIEAASFGLPVVNIGNRQRGREHARNVIDVPCEHITILNAIRRATSPEFRINLAQLSNPYEHGDAAEKIIRDLGDVKLGPELLLKHFYDLPIEVK